MVECLPRFASLDVQAGSGGSTRKRSAGICYFNKAVVNEMGQNPSEVAFFKALFSEFNKATQFFGKAEEEVSIREKRIQNGMRMATNSVRTDGTRLQLMAVKSLCRIYKDLLSLETFAIMTYCSVSRILRKHDKATGLRTHSAFMNKVVNKANVTNYSGTMEMLQRTQVLFEDAMRSVVAQDKLKLFEDELLLVSVFTRLNKQAIDLLEAETEQLSPVKEKKARLNFTPSRKESSSTVLCAEEVEQQSLYDARGGKENSYEHQNILYTSLRAIINT
jgi:hypothetical protein